MVNKLNGRHLSWLLLVCLYGAVVANTAVKEYAYIYDSRHYENVIGAMDREIRDRYYGQKCTSIDLSDDEAEPVCYSLATVDGGVMYFDLTTPRGEAEQIKQAYDTAAYRFKIIVMIKFLTLFLLIWLIPSIILYPFWEWFLDGFHRGVLREPATLTAAPSNGVAVRRIENLLTRYFLFLERQGGLRNFILGIGFSLLFGIFDLLAPAKFSFLLLYLFPISLTTWFSGQAGGLLVAVICALFWAQTSSQVDLVAYTWNILSTVSIFFTISIMLIKIRHMWEKDNLLSRTDQLTGVMNRRAFEEIVEYEILSLQRQNAPFSLAYLDLDNFKEVNDRFGHKRGDELLKSVVACLREHLRRTDVVARLGGDEFTIFFPATDQPAVQCVMAKLKEQLQILSAENRWPITFSIGVITIVDSRYTLDEVITQADRLMYDVKRSGKNDVHYLSLPAEYEFSRQD